MMFNFDINFDTPTISCDKFMNRPKSCMNINSNVGGNNNDNHDDRSSSRGGGRGGAGLGGRGGGRGRGHGRDVTLKVIERAEDLLKKRPASSSSSSTSTARRPLSINPSPITGSTMNVVDAYPLMDAAKFMTKTEYSFLSQSVVPLMLGGSLDQTTSRSSKSKSAMRASQANEDHRGIVASNSFLSGKPTASMDHQDSGIAAFKSTGLDSPTSSDGGADASHFSLDALPTNNPLGGEGGDDTNVIIWTHQADRWQEKFHKLLEFRQKHGHCRIPHNWKVDIALAQWVKRQRYQLKLKQDGKRSTMTRERQELLDSIGFEWNAHEASWDERFKELQIFKSRHGHCDVPTRDKENPKLSIWVKSQRRQYKLFRMGQPSSMTAERLQKLSELGFEWDPRNHMARSNMTGV